MRENCQLLGFGVALGDVALHVLAVGEPWLESVLERPACHA